MQTSTDLTVMFKSELKRLIDHQKFNGQLLWQILQVIFQAEKQNMGSLSFYNL